MMKNFNSMLIKPWSEENHLMIFQSSNPRKKLNQKKITKPLKILTTKLNQSSLPLESKNNKLFHSSISKKPCWKHKMSSHHMSDSTRLKVTLPLIRKMPSLKSSKDSKKKDSKSETVIFSSKELKETLWTNSGKNMDIITIPSLPTWKKISKKELRKKKEINLKTKSWQLLSLVDKNMRISTNWKVCSRISCVETPIMFLWKKVNKN